MKNYIEEDVINKLSKVVLESFSLAEGLFKGKHSSRYVGHNMEYREHREYTPGDDIKFIDWKRYAKTERFYVKEFEEDFNYEVLIILDTSKSMAESYTKTMQKSEYSKYLAMCLAFLFLKQNDSVGVATFSDEFNYIFPFTKNINLISHLNTALGNINYKKKTDLFCIKDAIKPHLNKRILIFIVSDFILHLENIFDFLPTIFSQKNEIILFHLIDEVEKQFNLKGEYVFIEPESGKKISLNASAVKQKFITLMKDFVIQLQNYSLNKGIKYFEFLTNKHYSENLLKFIQKGI